MTDIDYAALVTFIEFNWKTFVRYFEDEQEAERTFEGLRRQAGMN